MRKEFVPDIIASRQRPVYNCEMAEPLAQRKCVPCRGGTPPLPQDKATELLAQLKGWNLNDQGHLAKSIKTKDFASALELVNKIGRLAEEEAHHPDLTLTWGRVAIELWTHKIGGLSESDFILAAKIDQMVG